jgi:hypothetical protein
MFASLIFTFNRLLQLLTLIPTLGLLAYFVNIYNSARQLTPSYILAPFIIVVLATAWALITLIRRDSTRRSALFVALVDLLFLGAFIAAAWELRGLAGADCSNWTGGVSGSSSSDGNGGGSATVTFSPVGLQVNKTCAMLKACFAFCIINCLLWATTAFMAMFLHRHDRGAGRKETVVYRSRSHGSRRGHSGHRHRSSSRSRYHV